MPLFTLFSELVYRVAAVGAALAATGFALDAVRSSRRRAFASNLPHSPSAPGPPPPPSSTPLTTDDSPLLHTSDHGMTYWPPGHFERNLARAAEHGGGAGVGLAAPVLDERHVKKSVGAVAAPLLPPPPPESKLRQDENLKDNDAEKAFDELSLYGYW